MKKTRTLLSAIAALLLAAVSAFSFAACMPDNGGNGGTPSGGKKPEDFGITDSSSDNLSLQSIKLSGDYKTEFELGEAFTSDGIVVTATYIDASVSETYIRTETVASGDYSVDSSEFISSRVGTYNIYVSFTRTKVTRTASYSVNVNPAEPSYGGIIAELAEGKEDAFTLTQDALSVEVPKDILAVYSVDEKGAKSEQPLSEELYEAELYLGAQKIENNTATENGVYSFVATLKEDETKQDFINVYIVNPVQEIALKTSDESVFEQTAGSKDEISGTWQFTVTYANGTEKTVKTGDEGLTIDIDTKTAGNDKTATVTYSEKDAKGVSHEVTCSVTYTIKAKEVSGAVEYTMTYTAKTTDTTAKTGSYEVGFTGDNGEDLKNTVSVTNTASTFNTKEKSTQDGNVTLSDYAEIKAYSSKSITVKVGAGATNVSIKVYVSHTSSDARTIYLATATVATDESKVLDSKTIGGTGLDKNKLHVLEKSNLTEGEYYIFTDSTTVHCYQVVITYTVENSGGDTKPDGFEIDLTDTATAKGLKQEDNQKVTLSDGEELKEGTGVFVTNGLDLEYNKKSLDGRNFYFRLKLGGTGSLTKSNIKFENLQAGATITIYGITSSSNSLDRTLSLYTAEGTLVEGSTTEGFPNELTAVTFAVESDGTYYVWGSNAINIYYIAVSY